MKKSYAYGIVAVMVFAVVAMAGVAQLYSVYNPQEKRNVPIDRVSVDQIKSWANNPSFTKWTNMEGLEEYLADKGIDLQELIEESNDLSNRELLSLTGQKGIEKRYESRADTGEKAVTEIECDADDGELEFTLENIGDRNWFLVDQRLTTGVVTAEGRKVMSDALSNAKQIEFYVNNFLVNSGSQRYWLGEKLFFDEGETFGTACQADFLRTGKSVECTLEPIPVRDGEFIYNNYQLVAPGYHERGTFTCD